MTDDVPTATRHSRPGWRDPRILVGLAIVAASVIVGVKVLASADDSVGVWAVRKDLPAGTRVGAPEVQRVQIRFTSTGDADRYLPADSPLRRLDNVFINPHVGAATAEADARLWEVVGENLRRVLDGEPPLNVVNEVLARSSAERG